MSLRQKLRSELEAPFELRLFGSGWIAGTLALALALGALALVLVLRQPNLLGMPELSVLHNASWIKLVLFADMLAAFALSCLSLVLRPSKLLGALAIGLTLIASLWGSLPAMGDLTQGRHIYFGLDFFIINVIFGGVLFIPLERMFSHNKGQPVFRTEWREDLFYYFLSSMLVQVFTFTTLAPSNFLVATGAFNALRNWWAHCPSSYRCSASWR